MVGLGETLVGNFPGSALRFTVRKGGKGEEAITLLAFPSKPVALVAPRHGVIFRSDSNAEDLQGYGR